MASVAVSPVSSPVWERLRQGPLKVLIVGGGNWGTSVARIVARNAASSYIFASSVSIWIREEMFNGRKLTELFNANHENPKYLPGIALPENLTAVPDLLPSAEVADLLVFVLPHQFIESTVSELKGHVKPTARAISLVKGIGVKDGSPYLFSDHILSQLQISCSVLSGANVANDIARDQFSESTLGYPVSEPDTAAVWQQLFDCPTFKVNGLPDIKGIEVCGALKNVVALAAGFCDGLGLGTNTKAAIIRIGVEEVKFFATFFFSPILHDTFFDSAGYADVITTCFGGRNVRCATEFARRQGKDSWEVLEEQLLGGQKLQGQLTCSDIYSVIVHHQLHYKMPLFVTTYNIAFNGAPITDIINHFAVALPRPIKYVNVCNKIPKV